MTLKKIHVRQQSPCQSVCRELLEWDVIKNFRVGRLIKRIKLKGGFFIQASKQNL